MTCSKCGIQLSDDTKFCAGCGASVEAAPQEQPAQQPISQPIEQPPVAPAVEQPVQQTAAATPNAYTQPPASAYQYQQPAYSPMAQPKKKTGLVVTLCCVGAALIIGAIVLIFFMMQGGGTMQDGYFRNSTWGMSIEQVKELESGYRTTLRGTSLTMTTEDNYGLIGVSSYVSFGFENGILVRGTISPYDEFDDASYTALINAYAQKYGKNYRVVDNADGTSSYYWTTKTCEIEMEKETDNEVWIRFVSFGN